MTARDLPYLRPGFVGGTVGGRPIPRAARDRHLEKARGVRLCGKCGTRARLIPSPPRCPFCPARVE
jgi:hypothetical protein